MSTSVSEGHPVAVLRVEVSLSGKGQRVWMEGYRTANQNHEWKLEGGAEWGQQGP